MCSGGDKLSTNYLLGVVVSSHHVQKVSCRECSSSVSRYSNGDVAELLSNCGLSRRTSIVTNVTEVVAPASLRRRDALQLLQIAAPLTPTAMMTSSPAARADTAPAVPAIPN